MKKGFIKGFIKVAGVHQNSVSVDHKKAQGFIKNDEPLMNPLIIDSHKYNQGVHQIYKGVGVCCFSNRIFKKVLHDRAREENDEPPASGGLNHG